MKIENNGERGKDGLARYTFMPECGEETKFMEAFLAWVKLLPVYGYKMPKMNWFFDAPANPVNPS